jgi:hypothetical protein
VYGRDIQGQILLDLNVDGLPLLNSIGGQFWPIIDRSKPLISNPFFIALYYTEHKPQSMDFLQDSI